MAKNDKEANKKSRYFKDMKAELKKVVWPAPKQLANNTITVIVFTLVLGLIVFVLDLCFDIINKNGVVALQQKITSSYSSTNSVDNTTGENTVDENSTESSDNNSVKAEVETETKNDENKDENKTTSSGNNVEANSTNTESKK